MPGHSDTNRLTGEVVIRLAGLLGHVELIEVDVLAVEGQRAAYLTQMLVEPIDRPHHEVVAVHLRLDIELMCECSCLRRCRLAPGHRRRRDAAAYPRCH